MADLEIFGHGESGEKRNRYWLMGGAALVVILLLARRQPPQMAGAVAATGADPNAMAAAEFYMAAETARTDLAHLNAATALEMKRLDIQQMVASGQLTLAMNQATANRTCIGWDMWLSLPNDQRQAILSEVTAGRAVLQPSVAGMCVTPTAMGAAGILPPSTTSSSRGLFGSSSSSTGYFTPTPMAAPGGSVSGDWLAAYLAYLGA